MLGLILFMLALAEARSQPAAPAAARSNRALRLDGTGYLEVPTALLDGMNEMTFEAWVRFDELGHYTPIFSFGKPYQCISLVAAERADGRLVFRISGAAAKEVRIDRILRPARWYHVAAVSSSAVMQLYVNGLLVGSHDSSTGLADLLSGTVTDADMTARWIDLKSVLPKTLRTNLTEVVRTNACYFGRSVWESTWLRAFRMHGQMDEIRLWTTARTAEEIRLNMHRRLEGSEPGLAALWNFDHTDDGSSTAPPNSPMQLRDGARIAELSFPSAAELELPMILTGDVRAPGEMSSSAAGPGRVDTVSIQLRRDGHLVNSFLAHDKGYALAVYGEPGETLELSASGRLNQGLFRKGHGSIGILTNFTFQSGTAVTMDLALTDSSQLVGRVLDKDGKPQSDVVVQLVSPLRKQRVAPAEGFELEYLTWRVLSNASNVTATSPARVVKSAPVIELNETSLGEDSGWVESVRWRGRIQVEKAGDYVLFPRANRGVRLYVDGELIHADNELDFAEATLSAGAHELVLDYSLDEFSSQHPSCQLWWASDQLPISTDTDAKPLIQSISTEINGQFRFSRIPKGSYHLRSYLPGGYVEYQEGRKLEISQFTRIRDIEISLPRVQKGTWKNYTQLEGLAGNEVKKVAFAPNGTVWLATTQGASRFDGQEFTNFSQEDGLLSTRLETVYVDRTGRVWFGSTAGLVCYDPSRNHEGKKAWTYLTETNGLPARAVHSLLEDRQGQLWIATDAGLVLFNGQKITVRKQPDGQNWENIQGLAIGPDGAVWISAGDKGLWRLENEQGRKFGKEFNLDENLSTPHVAADGSVWVAPNSSAEIIHFTPPGSAGQPFKTEKFGASYGLVVDNVSLLQSERSGAIWMAARNGGIAGQWGAVKFEGTGFLYYTERAGLINNSLNDIQIAADGSIWIATDGGLSIFNHQTFTTYSSADGLTATPVTCLHAASEGLWIGAGPYKDRETTVSGLNLLTKDRFEPAFKARSDLWIYDFLQNSNLWAVDFKKGFLRIDGTSAVAAPFSGRSVNGILDAAQAPDGTIWLVSFAEGLIQVDPNKKKSAILRRLTSPESSPIRVHCDAKGRIWTGHYGSGSDRTNTCIYRVEGDKWIPVFTRDRSPTLPVCGISDGPNGSVWFATESGLLTWRNDGSPYVERHSNPLVNGSLRCLYRDRQGGYWLGTLASGVLHFNGQTWSALNKADGVFDNQVVAITEDEKGDLWFGSPKGLTRYRRNRQAPAPPQIEVVAASTRRVNAVQTVKQQELVRFIFKAVDFHTRAQAIHYRYRIIRELGGQAKEGTAWTNWGPANKFDWSPPRRGRYAFEVQSRDRDQNLSQPGIVQINVTPLWYLDPLIAAPAGLAVAGLIGTSAVSTARLRKKRQEAQRLRKELSEREHEAKIELEKQNEELKRAKDQADAANHSKSLFLANMSHEIRTPMNAILGYSQILKRDKELLPKHRQSIETIEKSGDHLLGMINDILDLSKIEAGRMELQTTDFDLNELIAGIESMFRVRCQEKELQLNVVKPGDGPNPVSGDEGKLRQVLINLMGNAVKFTDAGEVTLKVRSTPHPMGEGRGEGSSATLYRFDIIDTGPGISEADQKEIFQPFQQSAAGLKKGGTGLGLAITRRQLELMGGEVKLESTMGKGSRFYFEIRLRPAQGQVQAREAKKVREAVSLAGGTKVNALIVDDNQNNRDVLSQLLAGIGCRVRAAESALEAFERVKEELPDIIFMDIRMPGMNGAEATRQIIAAHGPDKIKVVAITASVLEHEKAGHMAAGFHSFLSKPFRFPDVCASLQQLLKVDFEYEDEAAAHGQAPEELEPADCSMPLAVWESLREAANRYSLTGLKKALETLEQNGESRGKVAEHLKRLIHDGDLDRVGTFLDQVKDKGAVA